MRTFKLLLPVVLLVVCVSLLQADTIHVPSEQPTIQAGIDAAVDGDTVLVAEGIYEGSGNRDIDFLGKAIVVMSENGYETTIIDCQHLGRGFYFHSGEGQSSIVQGFTIRGGNAGGGQGGAIFCNNTSPSILQCYFFDNEANIGGGIACDTGAMPLIDECKFTDNSGIPYGGGIHCDHGSDATISRCEFYGNVSASGGGIRCGVSSPLIYKCLIEGNIASAAGGGIECRENASPSISDCIIRNNNGGNRGGGFGTGFSCFPTFTRCLFSNNVATNGGGVLVDVTSGPSFVNCTFSNNRALSGQGGALLVWGEGFPNYTNSILWNNEPEEIEIVDGSVSITYSDIEGGWTGEGNIEDDPMFVLSDKKDYRLLWESPCIDTADPTLFDPDGTRSDMGAHYFNQNDYLTLYMTPDETEVAQGGQMGVTYTIINRWPQQKPFSALTRVILPDGEIRTVLGPEDYHICGGYTARFHLTYDIPPCAYIGMYEYKALIGLPPSTLYDRDSFTFKVTE